MALLAELGDEASRAGRRAEPRADAQPAARAAFGARGRRSHRRALGDLRERRRCGSGRRHARRSAALGAGGGARAAAERGAAPRRPSRPRAAAGRVGGSIAHADPAAELPAVLLALDGEAIVRSAAGERAIPAASLFLGPFTTALAEGELLTALRLPDPPAGRAARVRGDRPPPRRLRAGRRGRRRRAGLRARRALRRVAPCRLPRRGGGARARTGRRRGGGGAARGRRRASRRATRTRRPPTAGRPRASRRCAPCSPPGWRVADERAVRMRVNGRDHVGLAEPRTLLSDFLRHGLGLTGTHVGCEHGGCGACTVLVDGRAGAVVPRCSRCRPRAPSC